ncbi:hypothetical protein B0H13DRAFT_1888103 [Mycena leptocephala]|nr:hypothetical protein B0H13DRAFT_1888103 [Mycena leptocephala]
MDPAASFNLNTTLGALQIGVLISYMLFGVTTTQTYIYYSRFPDDSRKLKALVAVVWVCEIVHALCVGHALYMYTISAYAHPERLAGPLPVSLDTSVLLSSGIVLCVQGFFSFRIYAFSGKLYVCILIWVMIFLRLLGSIIIFITTLRMPSLPHYEMQWEWLLTAVWCVSAANDLVIAATLAVLLRNRRTDVQRRYDFGIASEFKVTHIPCRTAALVDKLILWSIETGMLTSATSIAGLACFLTMENFIFLASYVVGARGEVVSVTSFYNFNHILPRSVFELALGKSELQGGAPRNERSFPAIVALDAYGKSYGDCDADHRRFQGDPQRVEQSRDREHLMYMPPSSEQLCNIVKKDGCFNSRTWANSNRETPGSTFETSIIY